MTDNKVDMKELEAEAAMFLSAARRYWNYCNKHGVYGAVIWCQDKTGFGAIYTRGEYRHQMMYNIEGAGRPVNFGQVRDDDDAAQQENGNG